MATYKVGADGKAEKGLKAGDQVVTGGGTFRITGVNEDGSYRSEKVSGTTTKDYKGEYSGKDYHNDTRTDGPLRNGYAKADGSKPNWSYKDTGVYTPGESPSIKGADMRRDMRWAGKTIEKNGWVISYDENGYAKSATNIRKGAHSETLANVYPKVDADGELIYPTYTDGSIGYRREDGTIGLDDTRYSGGVSDAQRQLQAADDALARLTGGGYGGTGYGTGYGTGEAPSYTSRYEERINDLADQILGRAPFSYDYSSDPLYKFYENRYQRNGERAMRDSLGEVAARTGGLSSSYAGSVAQQQYNEYMQGLDDMIPELYNLAYSMYQNEGDQQRANLEMLRALESGDYAKFQDMLTQYNTDRAFDYNRFADQRDYEYQKERDQIDDQRYETEWEYKLRQAAQQAAQRSSKSSSGSSSRGGILDYDGLFEAAKRSGNPKSWLAQKGNYTRYGFTSSSGLYADYQAWEEKNGDTSGLGGSSGMPEYGDIRRTIMQLINQGNSDRAYEVYSRYFDSMSNAQQEELNRLLGGG